jgi:hypothetical protein
MKVIHDDFQFVMLIYRTGLHLLRCNTAPVLSVNLLVSCAMEYNTAVHKLGAYCARSSQDQ